MLQHLKVQYFAKESLFWRIRNKKARKREFSGFLNTFIYNSRFHSGKFQIKKPENVSSPAFLNIFIYNTRINFGEFEIKKPENVSSPAF